MAFVVRADRNLKLDFLTRHIGPLWFSRHHVRLEGDIPWLRHTLCWIAAQSMGNRIQTSGPYIGAARLHCTRAAALEAMRAILAFGFMSKKVARRRLCQVCMARSTRQNSNQQRSPAHTYAAHG